MTLYAMCFQKIVYSVTGDGTLKVELSQLNMTFIETQEIIHTAQLLRFRICAWQKTWLILTVLHDSKLNSKQSQPVFVSC